GGQRAAKSAAAGGRRPACDRPGHMIARDGRIRRGRLALWWGAGSLATAATMAAGLLLAGRSAGFLLVVPGGGAVWAILVFGVTYLVIALGKLPGFYLDRTGAALLGAALMVALGALSLNEALRAIDFATIALLLGMMIVVGNLRLSGFFRIVANWVVRR